MRGSGATSAVPKGQRKSTPRWLSFAGSSPYRQRKRNARCRPASGRARFPTAATCNSTACSVPPRIRQMQLSRPPGTLKTGKHTVSSSTRSGGMAGCPVRSRQALHTSSVVICGTRRAFPLSRSAPVFSSQNRIRRAPFPSRRKAPRNVQAGENPVAKSAGFPCAQSIIRGLHCQSFPGFSGRVGVDGCASRTLAAARRIW